MPDPDATGLITNLMQKHWAMTNTVLLPSPFHEHYSEPVRDPTTALRLFFSRVSPPPCDDYHLATAKKRAPSMATSNNSKHTVLVNCSASLLSHFAACDILTVGSSLTGEGLIPYGVYTELSDSVSTPQAKAGKVAQAVTLTVLAKPFQFVGLVELLEKQGMRELAEILKDELSKLDLGGRWRERM